MSALLPEVCKGRHILHMRFCYFSFFVVISLKNWKFDYLVFSWELIFANSSWLKICKNQVWWNPPKFVKFAKNFSSKNYFLFCFRPICYWIIFVVLNVWAIYYFHIKNLVFGQSLRVNILKSGSGLPMSSFIDAFVLEQRLQKLMVWKDLIFFTFLSILLLATCEGLRKAFFIYYYYFFVIFIFLFQSSNILSQEDILSKIYSHKKFFVFDIF